MLHLHILWMVDDHLEQIEQNQEFHLKLVQDSGQSILAAITESPVTCMETAGEGGAWGAALLAAFAVSGNGLTLPEFLNRKVFAGAKGSTLKPEEADIEGISEFMALYKKWIAAEKAAVSADGR